MALKFQLLNNSFGSLIIGKNDPIGINDITQTIKRSEEHEGIVFEIVLDLEFIKEARQYLIDCFEQDGGIDAVVIVNIYDYNPNTYIWELYYSGMVNYQRYEKTETEVIVTLEQAGKDRNVLNKLNQDIDAETEVSENGSALGEQTVIESEWHSKSIRKTFEGEPSTSTEFQQLDSGTISLPATGGVVNSVEVDIIWYGQFDNEEFTHNELEDCFSTPFGFQLYANPTGQDFLDGAGTEAEYINLLTDPGSVTGFSVPTRNPMYVAAEKGVTNVNLQIKAKARITANNTGGDVDLNSGIGGVLGFCEVNAWFEHRDGLDNILLIERIGTWDMSTGESDYETKVYSKLNLDLEVGHKLYVYNTFRVYADYEPPNVGDSTGLVNHDLFIQLDKDETFFNITSDTLAPATQVSSILIYEVFERCLQFLTNDPVCFYSELLGRTDLGYAEDGEASLIAINNGHWIRQRHDWRNNEKGKKLFVNLKDLIEFVNQYQCVGFGFETVNIDGELVGTGDTGMPYGTRVFRLEKREHFYRKEIVVSLGKVYNIREKLNQKLYYGIFEYGYIGKLDTKLSNATDEFNTLRKGRIPVVNTKGELKIAAKLRTSGYQIELQRRLYDKTEDSNHDDEVFATSMVRSGDDYRPKRDDGYAEINNVIEPETGYNYDFSPARSRKNWLKIIAACLIRHKGDKKLFFSSGQANYRMSTRKDTEFELVTEDGDEDLTVISPYYDPTTYSLENVRLTREQVILIHRNPYGMVELEDKDGNLLYGFLGNNSGADHDPFKRQGSFDLLKVHNPV